MQRAIAGVVGVLGFIAGLGSFATWFAEANSQLPEKIQSELTVYLIFGVGGLVVLVVAGCVYVAYAEKKIRLLKEHFEHFKRLYKNTMEHFRRNTESAVKAGNSVEDEVKRVLRDHGKEYRVLYRDLFHEEYEEKDGD